MLLHHNVHVVNISMNKVFLVKRSELSDDIVKVGIRRREIHQMTIMLPNHLHNNHVPSSWVRLGGKGKLTLVSKCLSEIASTEGIIWMVSMMCEIEQQIGGGQVKDIGRGE